VDASFWQEFKNIITDVLPITHDALHVLAGLGIHLTACWLFKKPLHWPGALLLVAGIEGLAELQDSIDDRRVYGFWIWRESAKDFCLTIAPSVMLSIYSKLSSRTT